MRNQTLSFIAPLPVVAALAALASLSAIACERHEPKGETTITQANPPANPHLQPQPPNTSVPQIEQGAPQASPQGPAAVAHEEPTATNALDVKRFDDERKLSAPAAGKLTRGETARTAPEGGEPVLALLSGAEIIVVSERGNAILVAFVDPKNPAQHRMGWLPRASVKREPAKK